MLFTLLYEHVPAKLNSAQRAPALELPAKRLRLEGRDRCAAFALVAIALQSSYCAAKEAGVKIYYIEDESATAQTQVPESIQYLKWLKLWKP